MLPRFVTFTYFLEFPHSLGEQPALNVAFILGFKEFEASGVFIEQLCRKKFLLGLSYLITFLDSSLVAGGLQEVHFQTPQEQVRLQKTIAETKSVWSHFFSSGLLRGLRDQHVMLDF